MRLAPPLLSLALIAAPGRAAEPPNLCPNAGAEEGAEGKVSGWYVEGGPGGEWAEDQVHSGRRSLRIVSDRTGPTRGWV